MQSYTATAKNTLQAGLRQSEKQNHKQTVASWVGPHFKEGDYLVTLTFQPWVRFDEAARSLDVKHFLTRLNRKIYGKAFERGEKRLNSWPIFEYNYSDGLHVHMLLEKPTDLSRLNVPFDYLVIDTWTRMQNGGVPQAQDVRDCTDVKRLLSYMTKQMRTADKLLMVDANNIHWQ